MSLIKGRRCTPFHELAHRGLPIVTRYAGRRALDRCGSAKKSSRL